MSDETVTIANAHWLRSNPYPDALRYARWRALQPWWMRFIEWIER